MTLSTNGYYYDSWLVFFCINTRQNKSFHASLLQFAFQVSGVLLVVMCTDRVELTSHMRRTFHQRLIQVIICIICFAGAIYQISQISLIYFSYATSSAVELKIPNHYKIDSLTFCTRYIDVLDFKRIREDNKSRNWFLTLTAYWIRRYQDELTISEILKYTPKESDFIDNASYRRKSTFKLFECDSTSCAKFFTIRRFVYLEYICYTVDAQYKNESLSYQALTITPSAAGEIFDITLSDKLNDSHLIKIVSHEPGTLPYKSLQNVARQQREFDESRAANFNSFTSSAVKLLIHRLPAPYDTMCVDYKSFGFVRRYDAIQICITQKVVQYFNKLPFSVIVDEPINLSVISYLDIENKAKTAKLIEFENECTKKYPHEDCISEISFTATHTDVGDRLSLRLITATSPFTNIKFVTQTSFVQVVSVVMSTASTWTSFAVISLNPVFLFTHMKGAVRHFSRWFTRDSESTVHPQRDIHPVNASINTATLLDHLKHQRKIYQLVCHIENRIKRLEMKIANHPQRN